MRSACGVAGLMGLYVVYFLGSELWTEVASLRRDIASARDAKPVGYVGIAHGFPGMRPMDGCVRKVNGRVLLWAGSRNNVGPDEWFDVTGVDLPLNEFIYALGRDRVHTIDQPIFTKPDGAIAQNIYPEREVFGLELEGECRAYPHTVMAKCEVVNDVFGAKPLAVTYCPIIDMAAVYDRVLDGEVISFGTSGYVYHGVFVLYDRRTDSLWMPRKEGLTAFSGPMTGKVLRQVATPERTEWGRWKSRRPDTMVLVGADRAREAADEQRRLGVKPL